FWTKFSAVHPWVDWWTSSFVFLYGPVTFFYVKQLKEKKLPQKVWLHILPFYFNALWSVPFILRNLFGKIVFLNRNFFRCDEFISDMQVSWIVLSLVSLIGYSIMIYIET